MENHDVGTDIGECLRSSLNILLQQGDGFVPLPGHPKPRDVDTYPGGSMALKLWLSEAVDRGYNQSDTMLTQDDSPFQRVELVFPRPAERLRRR